MSKPESFTQEEYDAAVKEWESQNSFTQEEYDAAVLEYEAEQQDNSFTQIEYDAALAEYENRPLYEDEFVRKWNEDQANKGGFWDFAEGFWQGGKETAKDIGRTYLGVLEEGLGFWQNKKDKPFGERLKSLGQSTLAGTESSGLETVQFVKNLAGEIKDEFSDDEVAREYDRYLEKYYTSEASEKMLSEADMPNLAKFVNYVDPASTAFPGAKAGTLLKAGAKTGGKFAFKVGGKLADVSGKASGKVQKIASVPRKAMGKVFREFGPVATTLTAVGGSYSLLKPVGELGGVMQNVLQYGATPFTVALGIDALSALGEKTGKGLYRVGQFISTPTGHRALLNKIAESSTLGENIIGKGVRNTAALAHELGATRMGMAASKVVANTMATGALNAAMSAVDADTAYDIGYGTGAGYAQAGLAQAPITGMGPEGYKTIVDNSGRSTIKSNEAIKLYAEKLNTEVQRKEFKKMPKNLQAIVASISQVGGSLKEIGVRFTNTDVINEHFKLLQQDGIEVKGKRPNVFYDPQSSMIFINSDTIGSMKNTKARKEANRVLLSEYGRIVAKDIMENNEAVFNKITEKIGLKDSGELLQYRNSKNILYGDEVLKTDKDAVIDYMSDVFADNMVKKGAIKGIQSPKITRLAYGVLGKTLHRIGIINRWGELSKDPVSRSLMKSPEIVDIYNNYLQAQNKFWGNIEKKNQEIGGKVKMTTFEDFKTKGGKVFTPINVNLNRESINPKVSADKLNKIANTKDVKASGFNKKADSLDVKAEKANSDASVIDAQIERKKLQASKKEEYISKKENRAKQEEAKGNNKEAKVLIAEAKAGRKALKFLIN
jgi:hypothetical protein